MKFKRIKLSGHTSKQFKQHDFAEVNRLVVAPTSEEQAHDKEVREGKVVPEQVPVSQEESWWRRWIHAIADQWG